jgi:hypothetical protein
MTQFLLALVGWDGFSVSILRRTANEGQTDTDEASTKKARVTRLAKCYRQQKARYNQNTNPFHDCSLMGTLLANKKSCLAIKGYTKAN